ncbi:MAG: hypothetical protein HYY18_15480, partial [Planctomycetes bacterium]|nr:hypothetical protein [Planctomycetota bacterium]
IAAGSGPSVESPAVSACAADHPLLLNLDLSRLRIARARPFPRDPSLAVLIDSAAGPLAVASDSSVSLAFALEDSNLPLLAAFPLFVRNCVEELSRERPLPPARIGDWTAPFPGRFEAWRDGTAWTHSGPWLADRPGVVVFTRDGASRPLAVNFFNPAESALPVPPPGREPPSPRVDPPPAWALLAAAAAVLLGIEWTLLRGGRK